MNLQPDEGGAGFSLRVGTPADACYFLSAACQFSTTPVGVMLSSPTPQDPGGFRQAAASCR